MKVGVSGPQSGLKPGLNSNTPSLPSDRDLKNSLEYGSPRAHGALFLETSQTQRPKGIRWGRVGLVWSAWSGLVRSSWSCLVWLGLIWFDLIWRWRVATSVEVLSSLATIASSVMPDSVETVSTSKRWHQMKQKMTKTKKIGRWIYLYQVGNRHKVVCKPCDDG